MVNFQVCLSSLVIFFFLTYEEDYGILDPFCALNYYLEWQILEPPPWDVNGDLGKVKMLYKKTLKVGFIYWALTVCKGRNLEVKK